MRFKQEVTIPTLSGKLLELVDQSTYLGSNISSTERDVNMLITKALTTMDVLTIIWKSDIFYKVKWDLFQAVSVSALLYGCPTLTLTKHQEKKLVGKDIRMLCALMNKSWKQHPAKQQLYSHLPTIS